MGTGGDIDATSGAINFNGNDAFEIVDAGGNVIDSFRQAGDSTNFDAADVTLRRNEFTRDTDITDAYDITAQWDAFGSNDVSDLGLAPGDDGGGGGDPDPTCLTPDEDLTRISEIQGSSADPEARFDSPLDGETVTIRAVVTLADSDLARLLRSGGAGRSRRRPAVIGGSVRVPIEWPTAG